MLQVSLFRTQFKRTKHNRYHRVTKQQQMTNKPKNQQETQKTIIKNLLDGELTGGGKGIPLNLLLSPPTLLPNPNVLLKVDSGLAGVGEICVEPAPPGHFVEVVVLVISLPNTTA